MSKIPSVVLQVRLSPVLSQAIVESARKVGLSPSAFVAEVADSFLASQRLPSVAPSGGNCIGSRAARSNSEVDKQDSFPFPAETYNVSLQR